MRNTGKRLALWSALIAAALMIPALAKWPWTGSDYIAAAAVLFVAALAYELATANINSGWRRAVIGAAVAALVLWLWAELAVGVVTSWGS